VVVGLPGRNAAGDWRWQPRLGLIREIPAAGAIVTGLVLAPVVGILSTLVLIGFLEAAGSLDSLNRRSSRNDLNH
jgi:hypothetical protein